MNYAVTNPATGEVVRSFETISDAELEQAIASADRAFREWSRSTTVDERAALVRRVGELHVERRQELADIIVREMGKPVEQALGEVDFAGAIYEYYADNAADFTKDEPITLSDGEGSAIVRRSALGVLLGIMPWNFPYYQVARFAGPNLVIGNTILLKHAEQCPESAAAIERIFLDAGLPGGRLRQHLRLPPADRDGDRGPARAGGVVDRVRAGRRCGGGGRRPAPEEGSAGARRVGPVHPAVHRRPGCDRRRRRRRPLGQQRAVVQRRQAVRRPREPVRRVPGEVHRQTGRGGGHRPDRSGCGTRPAVLAESRRDPG